MIEELEKHILILLEQMEKYSSDVAYISDWLYDAIQAECPLKINGPIKDPILSRFDHLLLFNRIKVFPKRVMKSKNN